MGLMEQQFVSFGSYGFRDMASENMRWHLGGSIEMNGLVIQPIWPKSVSNELSGPAICFVWTLEKSAPYGKLLLVSFIKNSYSILTVLHALKLKIQPSDIELFLVMQEVCRKMWILCRSKVYLFSTILKIYIKKSWSEMETTVKYPILSVYHENRSFIISIIKCVLYLCQKVLKIVFHGKWQYWLSYRSFISHRLSLITIFDFLKNNGTE